MTGYCDEIRATPNHSTHYESCLNSNCSRSPSPVHRQLWEPKHTPQKLGNNKKWPALKPIDTAKQNTYHTRNRDKCAFLPPCDLNGVSTTRINADPLFTYTIKEGPIDNANGTKNVEVKIQKHLDYDFSPPSPRNRTPKACRSDPSIQDQVAPRNLKLELELDTSRVPPIVTIKNNTTIPNTYQTTQPASSIPLTTGPKSSSPRQERKSGSFCSTCIYPQPCSAQDTIESFDSIIRQPCPVPHLSFPKSISREDKATSPIKPCSTPQTSCNSIFQGCPKSCSYLSFPSNKEDKAISPINLDSRSPSPCHPENGNPDHNHGLSNFNSDIGSERTIDIKIDEASKVQVDWQGDVGPINIDFPITRNQGNGVDDQVHSHDPQLEAFYTSSYNQSGSASPSRSGSFSPSPPASARHSSRSIAPPWNSCCHVDSDCFNQTHLTSISPLRSPCSQSTSCSRSPQSKNGWNQNNFGSSLELYTGGDGETSSNVEWRYSIPDVGTQNTFSLPENFISKEQHLNMRNQLSSPTLTLTPHNIGNGQMTIEWNNPTSIDEERCKTFDSLAFKGGNSQVGYKDVQRSHYQDEVGREEKTSIPQAPVPAYAQHATPIPNLENKNCNQSKECSCISTCKPPCIPLCDTCQGTDTCYNYCCCCNKDCLELIEGVNKCTSLPPHLQSDWSASLRCPSGQTRTKPILYRDTKGHEHIMFADGSIEHLNQHCEPTTTIPPQPSYHPPPPPPRPIAPFSSTPTSPCHHLFNHDGENFDRFTSTNFSPQSGDIVIRAHQRLSCMHPGKDNGQVAFFTSDYLDLQEGDSIVRLGKFYNSGQWCRSKLVEMYLRGSHGQWMFLGTTQGSYALSPLEADQHQTVRTPNKQLKLRVGDLLISAFPKPNSFYFWNPKMKLDCDNSHLLLRAYIGQPQVVDENHNLACCVDGHLPVGYVELYVKVKRIWLFLGRDDHMFSEHELMYFS